MNEERDQAVRDTVRELGKGVAWVGGIVALALAASYARRHGYIEHETMLRLVVGANGPLMCYIGNRAPKMFLPAAVAGAPHLRRFAGWAIVLSGITYTLLWTFAPVPVAVAWGSGAVLTGGLATLAYWLRLRRRTQRAS